MATKKKSARSAKRAPGGRTDLPRMAIEAALRLTASQGWRGLTMAEIAAETGLGLADLYALFPTKEALLMEFVRGIDRSVLMGSSLEETRAEPARDRLFDVLMRRLDALAPHKTAVRRIVQDLPIDPISMACMACALPRSMAWMLEAAGIGTGGVEGRIRIKGLSAIWLITLRAWLRDDSDDMAATMAALDRQLGRVDAVLDRLRPLCRSARGTQSANA